MLLPLLPHEPLQHGVRVADDAADDFARGLDRVDEPGVLSDEERRALTIACFERLPHSRARFAAARSELVFTPAPLGDEPVAHYARPGARPDASVGDVRNLRQYRVVPVALENRLLVRIGDRGLVGCEQAGAE